MLIWRTHSTALKEQEDGCIGNEHHSAMTFVLVALIDEWKVPSQVIRDTRQQVDSILIQGIYNDSFFKSKSEELIHLFAEKSWSSPLKNTSTTSTRTTIDKDVLCWPWKCDKTLHAFIICHVSVRLTLDGAFTHNSSAKDTHTAHSANTDVNIERHSGVTDFSRIVFGFEKFE